MAKVFLEPAGLLTGAVLRLYVRVGFVSVGAPKGGKVSGDGEDRAEKVTGAGAGWTVSYNAGAGAGVGSGDGDGAGSATVGASAGGTSFACSVVGAKGSTVGGGAGVAAFFRRPK